MADNQKVLTKADLGYFDKIFVCQSWVNYFHIICNAYYVSPMTKSRGVRGLELNH
jgi:hypothetical protein